MFQWRCRQKQGSRSLLHASDNSANSANSANSDWESLGPMSKAAWSMFQSLFWLEKHYFWILQPKETSKLNPKSQKMRLDALIIFLIE